MAEASDDEIIHREIDTEATNPAVEITTVIEEIDDKDTNELPTMYECVDGVLKNVFSTPPDPEAQLQIEFSYETYRITMNRTAM